MNRFVRTFLTPASAMFTFGATGSLHAQTVPVGTSSNDSANAKQASTDSPSEVEHIKVVGHPFNTLHVTNRMGRMPQDVLHTAQTIDVVPKELMEQQNSKSLDEALKNVPGVTSSVGEGAGGMSGDQFLIRGFPAQNDIYEDGLRDFGVYARDNFYYDSVNVIKGPSSQIFGNGTGGGAINVVTKSPILKNFADADFTGGSGQYYRGTIDFNRRLDRTMAFRMQAMGNENNVVGRDHIYAHRWGLAPSLAVGLGTDTIVVFQLMHQSARGVPDFGVPAIKGIGPVTEHGLVARTNWYGKDQDHDRTDDTLETIRLTHNFNRNLIFHNDLRFGEYDRDFEASKADCKGACAKAFLSGHPEDAHVGRGSAGGGRDPSGIGNIGGAPQPYKQWSWSVQNVASLEADFKTGFLKHQLIGGFDMEYVHDRRRQYTFTSVIPDANGLHPNSHVGHLNKVPGSEASHNLVNLDGLGRKSDSTGYAFDAGIFMYDQIWFTRWLSIKGGFRWDRWQTAYNVTGGDPREPDKHFPNTRNVINPTASLIITPTRWQTYYFTYSTATTPTGMYVTSGSLPIRPPDNHIAKPEKSTLYEVGSKISAFQDRLGFTVSLFRLEKSNAMSVDPATGENISTSNSERNQGLETSISGDILPGWNVTATYALYDPQTTKSDTASNIGKMIRYVPHNQATLWSVYKAFPGKPWNFAIGGGVTWRQKVWLDVPNTVSVPANVDFDVVISHHFGKHWKLSLNGYNLANRLNYNSLFVNRVTPAPGRTFLGRIAMNY